MGGADKMGYHPSVTMATRSAWRLGRATRLRGLVGAVGIVDRRRLLRWLRKFVFLVGVVLLVLDQRRLLHNRLRVPKLVWGLHGA